MIFSYKPRFDVSFIDFLLNLMMVFIIIAIIAVIHMNPPTKKSDAPKKAEFLVIVEWNKETDNDVDVWINSRSLANPLHFRYLAVPPFYLERDDVGWRKEVYVDNDGVENTIHINREVVTVRGWPNEDEYFVNVHFYRQSRAQSSEIENVKVSIVVLNPYKVVYERTVMLTTEWEEKDVVAFKVSNQEIFNFYNDHNNFYVVDALGQRSYNNIIRGNRRDPL